MGEGNSYHSSSILAPMASKINLPRLLRIGEGKLQRGQGVHPAPEGDLVVVARDHHHRPRPRR